MNIGNSIRRSAEIENLRSCNQSAPLQLSFFQKEKIRILIRKKTKMANSNSTARLSLKSTQKRNQEAMSHSQMNNWINGEFNERQSAAIGGKQENNITK